MLDELGRRLLPWLTVTVGDLHGYLESWCDVLGVSTGGQEQSGTRPVPGSDRSVTG